MNNRTGAGMIYTEYRCKEGHKWHKYWRKPPWFGDYSLNCPRCNRLTWYCYKFDDRPR